MNNHLSVSSRVRRGPEVTRVRMSSAAGVSGDGLCLWDSVSSGWDDRVIGESTAASLLGRPRGMIPHYGDLYILHVYVYKDAPIHWSDIFIVDFVPWMCQWTKLFVNDVFVLGRKYGGCWCLVPVSEGRTIKLDLYGHNQLIIRPVWPSQSSKNITPFVGNKRLALMRRLSVRRLRMEPNIAGISGAIRCNCVANASTMGALALCAREL